MIDGLLQHPGPMVEKPRPRVGSAPAPPRGHPFKKGASIRGEPGQRVVLDA